MAALGPLLDAARPTRSAVERRAEQIGRNPSTLYHWLRFWRGSETLPWLVPRPPGARPTRLNEGTEAVVQAHLRGISGKLPRQSVACLLERIRAECAARAPARAA